MRETAASPTAPSSAAIYRRLLGYTRAHWRLAVLAVEVLELVAPVLNRRRAHDASILVDPHGRRNVDDPVAMRDNVIAVDECRMRRRDAFNVRPRVFGRLVESNRDDCELFLTELLLE